ncbi:glycosyltransferase [bacterium]|nr:glycosyltransferase [bacterium]
MSTDRGGGNTDTSSRPLVSVIMPTYNRGHLIQPAVKSVLGQTFTNFELVIVDDASSDDTAEVVASFQDDRIHYVKNTINQGAAGSRNSGFRAASSKYITYLDSDDEYLPTKLEKQVQKLESLEGSQLDCVLCGYKQTNRTKEVIIPSQRDTTYENVLWFREIVNTAQLMARRECIEAVGGWDSSLKTYDDWELILRLLKEYRFGVVPEALYIYHHHGGSRVHSALNRIAALNTIIHKYDSLLQQRAKLRSYYHAKIAREYRLIKDAAQERHHLAKASFAQPWNINRWVHYLSTFGGARLSSKVFEMYVTVKQKR